MAEKNPVPGTGGDRYVPFEERTGDTSPVVYFTKDITANGIAAVLKRVMEPLKGKVAIKLHTGEPHGPNIIPPDWVAKMMQEDLPDATVVECDTFYEGGRDTPEKHEETLRTNGWEVLPRPVDIMDAEGTVLFPVKGGKWFDEMSIGKDMADYDSLLVLTHFKGHPMAGFGGSAKNIGIGCADGKVGKKWIHQAEGSDNKWSIANEEFMERMMESAKSIVDHFGENIVYVNVMRDMSVDCDCTGIEAAPVVTPNVGVLASKDICAIDAACVDIVYAMKPEEHHDLVERMETRHGLRQISYMHEMGMGSDRYTLIDIDGGDHEITCKEAAADLEPFRREAGDCGYDNPYYKDGGPVVWK